MSGSHSCINISSADGSYDGKSYEEQKKIDGEHMDCLKQQQLPLDYMSLRPQSQRSPQPESKPLELTTKHLCHRKKAKQATIKSVENMARNYNNKKRVIVEEFQIGQPVSLAIPKIDRSATDFKRLPGVVIDVKGDKLKRYIVVTAFGVIKGQWRGGDLQKYTEKVN